MTKLGLTLGVLLSTCALSSPRGADGILDDNGTLVNQLAPGAMSARGSGAAFDGTYYWAGKAGSSSGVTLTQWDDNGVKLAEFSTLIDHRALFTDASGQLFAVDYGGGGTQVYSYDAAATPTLLYSLSPAPTDAQMEFGLRLSNQTMYGHSMGTIYAYDLATGSGGASFNLSGFAGASSYPANVQIAVHTDPLFGEILLTYDQSGLVQAFDFTGNLLGGCTIGLTSFDETFSFSVADALVWIERGAGGMWEGYDIGLNVGTLSGDVQSISLSTGGQQVLAMGVGTANAFKSYQVLGSFSGSVPGFVYTGTAIPLNPDPYTIFALLNPNQPPLLNSSGILDSQGAATAVFQVPPSTDPGLAGLVVNHAGIVIEPVGPNFVVTTATSAVPCQLVP